ncbi:hypothetical protein ACTXT7_012676 [Hymenolepis weldensis]
MSSVDVSHVSLSESRRDDRHPFSTPVHRFDHQSVFVARSTRRRGKCHRVLQIKPSSFELFVIAKFKALSGLHVVDIAAMSFGDYGSCPLKKYQSSWYRKIWCDHCMKSHIIEEPRRLRRNCLFCHHISIVRGEMRSDSYVASRK